MKTNSGMASSVEFVTTPNSRCGKRLNSSVPKPRKPNTKPEIASVSATGIPAISRTKNDASIRTASISIENIMLSAAPDELLIASDSDCMKNSAKPIGISALTT